MTRLELLAPARNASIGIAAINCGADAVYIGGPAWGARAAAGNSVEEIIGLCNYARPFGVRIFVTVNTLAADGQERRRMMDMMLSLKDKGVGAFILQDLSLLPLLKECGPWKEEFHASTQCTINSVERAVELAEMGFSRLILERELSLEQIRRIRAAVPAGVELETFVHGALCVCYSGECYLSEFLTGRSANRGECAQPCRSLYTLIDAESAVVCDDAGHKVENRPVLSLKDLCLIDNLAPLAMAGVVSFKIEGRLKNESYVKNVVKAYSEALDKLCSEIGYSRASSGRVHGGFRPSLDKTFNRSYTDLLIRGVKKPHSWNSGAFAKGMGEEIGKVLSVGKNFFTIDTRVPVSNGDGLCVISDGCCVTGFRADRVEGKNIICKVPKCLVKGMRVWRNLDTAFEKELERNAPERLIDVTLDVDATSPACLSVKAQASSGVSIEVKKDASGFAQASNRERMEEVIRIQMSKKALCYSFSVGSVSGKILPLLPASWLNETRREIAGKLAAIAVPSAKAAPAAINISKSALQGQPVGGVLMKSRYCILNELGLCAKSSQEGRALKSKGLFLVNNGRRIRLEFDCRKCEMSVLQ